jgi:hypothetical protein
MGARAVPVEQVFVSTMGGWHAGHSCIHGVLANKLGTQKWRCNHGHRSYPVAARCAEQQRRTWIRDGRASVIDDDLLRRMDVIADELERLDKTLAKVVLAHQLLHPVRSAS